MAEVEERIAMLEGRVQEQATRMADFRDSITDVRQTVLDLRGDVGRVRDELRGDIATLRQEMHGEIGQLRQAMHREIGQLRDGEVAQLRQEMHGGIGALRADFGQLRDEMDRRFDRVDQKFMWLVGIVVTACLATIATVAGAFFALLQAINRPV